MTEVNRQFFVRSPAGMLLLFFSLFLTRPPKRMESVMWCKFAAKFDGTSLFDRGPPTRQGKRCSVNDRLEMDAR